MRSVHAYSGAIGIAPPQPIIGDALATRRFDEPDIEEARLAETGEIAARMNDERRQQHPRRLEEQEELGRHYAVDDKIAVGDAREHLRARERRKQSVAIELIHVSKG